MKKIFSFYFITLFSLYTLFADDISKTSKEIAILSSSYLYNYDENGLLNALTPFLKSNPQIHGLEIYENVEKVLIVSYHKEKNKSFFNEEIPQNIKDFLTHTFPIYYNNELVGNGTIYYQKDNQLNLTNKEKEWLKSHPKIRVHNETNWAPMNFNLNGIPSGLSIDFMNYLAKKIGIDIEYVSGEWNDLYNKALNKNIDVMLNIVETEERKSFFLFTSSYQKNKIGIYALKENQNITSIDSLTGKKVAIVDGFFQNSIIKEKFPLIQILQVKNSEEALKAVCQKEVDAAIGSFIVLNHLMNELMCYELEYKNEISLDHNIDLRLGIRKDYPLFHSIVEKAMADMGSNELNDIRKKWITTNTKDQIISLSDDEKTWIKHHPIINVGGELDWAPFDFVDETNTYVGLSKDYLDLIASITGLQFKIHTGETWEQLLNSLKTGKIDILPAIYYKKERESFLKYTTPYLTITDFYITREEHKKINNIEELYGKKVGVIKGYELVSWLKTNHPKIQVIEFDTLLEVLRAIEAGEVVATINDNPSATYLIEKNFITALKMNNIVRERPLIPLHMGIKQEYEPLKNIINKALNAISREEKTQIAKRWMSEVKDGSISLEFSTKEIAWLSTKPVIQFAVDPNWLPIEGINKKTDQYEGMMADYLERIKELTGLNFELVKTNNWDESVQFAIDKKVNMLAAASITPDREKFLNFSNTTITLTDAVIMKSDASFITNIEDLKGLRIGVSEGTSVHKMLKQEHPELIIQPIKGTYNGVEQLDKGTIDAYIGNLEVISHIIFTNNLLNLKVVLKLNNERELHIALHKTYPKEAISVINKAINAISQEEINTIRKRWIGLQVNDKTDYVFILKITLAVFVIFLIILYHNRRLHLLVNQKTQNLQEQKEELKYLVDQFDNNVIFSKTDLNGTITHVSKAFCKLSGYSAEELIGKSHSIVKDPNMPQEVYIYLWHSLKKKEAISIELRNKKKNGEYYWLDSYFEPDYDKFGNHIGYTAIRADITAQKEVQKFSEVLEQKVEERTMELNNERLLINSIMNSQSNLVITSDGETLTNVNRAFLEFFEINDLQEFKEKYGNSICDTFFDNSGPEYIKKTTNSKAWSDYVYEHNDEIHKVIILKNEKEYIFTITIDKFLFGGKELETVVFSNITELEKIREEIEEIHKHTKDSIEYASLIQHTLIPDNQLINKYFSDYFTIWNPKDIVGGDIYLFDELRNENECLLMVIDCTGHGVAGAFVTMLVKAIERQLIAKILNSKEMVSPAKILRIFNKTMKQLLKQDNADSISNAGFDGGILYYNKKEGLVKYAGAETPLFYIDENNQLQTIKGSRHSVGYKKSDINYEFKEHTIEVKEGMQFYLTTDGYLDQNGGEKGFPFGKKRFTALIDKHKNDPFNNQHQILLDSINNYQQNSDRNDDITLVGLKI